MKVSLFQETGHGLQNILPKSNPSCTTHCVTLGESLNLSQENFILCKIPGRIVMTMK